MSIRSKILTAFIIVIAVAVLAMAFTSRYYIDSVFTRYTSGYRTVITEQWEAFFRSYYQRQGSWEGVEQLLTPRSRGRGMMPATQPAEQVRGGTHGLLPGDSLLLADADGRVVLDSSGEMTGQTLSFSLLDRGTPMLLEDQRIGTLIMEPQAVQAVQTLEEQFGQSLLRGVLWGGFIALLVGALLGFFLAGQVTRPLARLTASARQFARRDFSHRLELKQKDEVGKLASAFNLMAESIEKNEKLRRNLLADVSHELRTPLTILQGNFEALQSGQAQPTPELLSSLYDEVLRLGRLVSDMEAINVAEAGQLPLNLQSVEISALLHRAAGAFQFEAEERGIQLQIESEPGEQTWTLDEDRMVQVLINLLGNAFKFTPDGGRIALRAHRDPQQFVISVVDSGPGISPDDLPFIFERFYKVSQGRGGGSGLGLSIAKSFVEVHGGTIQAANLPTGGSVFSFSLPR